MLRFIAPPVSLKQLLVLMKRVNDKWIAYITAWVVKGQSQVYIFKESNPTTKPQKVFSDK